MDKISKNTFDLGIAIYSVSIISLSLGVLGGSLQLSRFTAVLFCIVSIIFARRDLSLDFISKEVILLVSSLWIFGGVSVFWAPDQEYAFRQYIVMLVNSTALIGAAITKIQRRKLNWVFYSWALASLCTVPFAVYEIITGAHFVSTFDERIVGGSIGKIAFASVFFGNPNNYSLFICITTTFALFMPVRGVIGRIMSIMVATFGIAIAGINVSRAAWIYMGIVLVIYVMQKKRIREALFISCIIPVVIVIYTRYDADALYKTIEYIMIKMEILGEGIAEEERFEAIPIAFEIMVRTFGFGGGLGSMEYEMATRYRWLIPNPHNAILEYVTNVGIVPTIILLKVATKIVYIAINERAIKVESNAIIVIIVMSPLLGIMNSSAFAYTYWWILFATLIIYARTVILAKEDMSVR